MRYRYSRWTGTQQAKGIDPEDVVDALADDFLAGDVSTALERAMRSGIAREDEKILPGLADLLTDIQEARHDLLARYDLDSMIDDIRDRVTDVVRTEQEAVDDLMRRSTVQESDSTLATVLHTVAEKRLRQLASLPPDPGGATDEVAGSEFIAPQARAKVDALLDVLERRLLQTHSRSLEETLLTVEEAGLDSLIEALRALNGLIAERRMDRVPDFDRFLEKNAQFFPAARSLDDMLIAIRQQANETQSLLSSMAPQARKRLDEAMESVARDPELRDELATLAEGIEALLPDQKPARTYPFFGNESLTLEDALQLMRRMHDLDALEAHIQNVLEDPTIPVDLERVRGVMGEEAGAQATAIAGLQSLLEDTGYVEGDNGSLKLTSRAVRRLGEKALEDIFRRVKHSRPGGHRAGSMGGGTDPSTEHKGYEFGDPMLPDMHETLMNAVRREGLGTPVRIRPEDFQVYATEESAGAATVLMLDLSRSMPLRGCFTAAKKVALALDTLIRTRFPRDELHVLGFSDLAREIQPESLHSLSSSEYVYGTNMQHALSAARRLLRRHRGGTRQIILITDGEPTAHMDGGKIHFEYPPSNATVIETLREVRRCTLDGIVIDTFMLARSHHLAEFVARVAELNQGRAFFATPDRLGDYVLLDYVASRMKARRV